MNTDTLTDAYNRESTLLKIQSRFDKIINYLPSSIIITEKNLYYKTPFKKITLPYKEISSIKIKKSFFYSQIIIKTTQKKEIKFKSNNKGILSLFGVLTNELLPVKPNFFENTVLIEDITNKKQKGKDKNIKNKIETQKNELPHRTETTYKENIKINNINNINNIDKNLKIINGASINIDSTFICNNINIDNLYNPYYTYKKNKKTSRIIDKNANIKLFYTLYNYIKNFKNYIIFIINSQNRNNFKNIKSKLLSIKNILLDLNTYSNIYYNYSKKTRVILTNINFKQFVASLKSLIKNFPTEAKIGFTYLNTLSKRTIIFINKYYNSFVYPQNTNKTKFENNNKYVKISDYKNKISTDAKNNELYRNMHIFRVRKIKENLKKLDTFNDELINNYSAPVIEEKHNDEIFVRSIK
ncbi:MAG: hypothetical protein ACP5RI_00485 [Candidatus Micrarchaeia archaeon]